MLEAIAGSPQATASIAFYARLDQSLPGATAYGSFQCVTRSAADLAVGSPVSLRRGGPSVGYSIAGEALAEGVRRGRFWLGGSVSVDNPGGLLSDLGRVDFTNNLASVRLR